MLEPHFDKGVKVNLTGQLSGEGLTGRGMWCLVFGRPVMPVPGVGIAAMEVAVKGHVSAIVVEPDAAGLTIPGEFVARAAFKLAIKQEQEESLEPCYLFIFDKGCVAE